MREFIYWKIMSISYKRAMYWSKKCSKASEKVAKWVGVHNKYYEKLYGKGGVE